MENFNLTGKTALITGGNGGIGLAMAKSLGQAGASVVIAGRNETKNKEICEFFKRFKHRLYITHCGCNQ